MKILVRTRVVEKLLKVRDTPRPDDVNYRDEAGLRDLLVLPNEGLPLIPA